MKRKAFFSLTIVLMLIFTGLSTLFATEVLFEDDFSEEIPVWDLYNGLKIIDGKLTVGENTDGYPTAQAIVGLEDWKDVAFEVDYGLHDKHSYGDIQFYTRWIDEDNHYEVRIIDGNYVSEYVAEDYKDLPPLRLPYNANSHEIWVLKWVDGKATLLASKAGVPEIPSASGATPYYGKMIRGKLAVEGNKITFSADYKDGKGFQEVISVTDKSSNPIQNGKVGMGYGHYVAVFDNFKVTDN